MIEKKNDPIRFILVDDHQLVREARKMLLENNPRFQMVPDPGNWQDGIN
ncbi:MAG: hypothetical protein SGI83_06805 [Bacteroidota bacterium]|nr:hypothetical protein [Bacteroidota bacterium]